MIGNASHDRDELLVTGIAPVASPPRPPAEPLAREEAETAPVFVDPTGGRARIGRRLGLLVGAVLLVFLGALGLGMTTGADVPLTSWSEPSAQPRAKVGRPSVPAGERAPSARPRPTGPAARSPRASAAPAVPGAPAAPAAPGTSSAPAAPSAATATGTATSAPGNSQATPRAWGRRKKSG